jgi:hypothetical protein
MVWVLYGVIPGLENGGKWSTERRFASPTMILTTDVNNKISDLTRWHIILQLCVHCREVYPRSVTLFSQIVTSMHSKYLYNALEI